MKFAMSYMRRTERVVLRRWGVSNVAHLLTSIDVSCAS